MRICLKPKRYTSIIVLLCIGVLISSPVSACTGIMLVGTDGTIMRSRTVEWGPFDLQLAIDVIPRGHEFDAGTMPDGKAGMKWKGRYGVIGLSMLGHPTPGDGINEAGLSRALALDWRTVSVQDVLEIVERTKDVSGGRTKI